MLATRRTSLIKFTTATRVIDDDHVNLDRVQGMNVGSCSFHLWLREE
jgi:hypothetical protein